MYVPRNKTVFSRRDPLAGGALDDTPIKVPSTIPLTTATIIKHFLTFPTITL